jgi:imidazolonepropionase-like amidohydrolase
MTKTRTLFTRVRIFDGTGAALFPGEVLVEGNRIAAVARGAERLSREGAMLIDGGGATLMPGLIEPHAHLTFTSAVDRIVPSFMPPVEDHVFYTAHNAKTLLDYGFTSAFSGGATRPGVEVKLRDEIAKGFLPGPRLRAASFERSIDGNRPGYGKGVEEVAKFCREMIGLGVDSMKFILSGAGSVLPSQFDELTYSEPELEAASALAREAGVNLLGHAYNSASIRLAMRYGFHAIFHCNFADAATLDLMEANKSKFFVVPAVGIIVAGLTRRDQILPGAIEQRPEAIEGLKIIHEAQLRVLPEMRKRGIRVLPGGDYGFAHNPHGRNAWEFELFVTKFGFTPAEVLVGATQHGGAIMRMGDELGLIKEGYLADILLVEGDPLRDIALLQNRDSFLAIMKDGAFHKAPAPALDLMAD